MCGICIHIHIHTQIHKHTFHTLCSYLYTRSSTHIPHTRCVCEYQSIPIHSCTHSLPLSHTHPQAHRLPCCPPSYLISCLCCLQVHLQQCCHHLQPCSVAYCQMQRQPAILRKSRQQTMSAHCTRSLPGTRPRSCVLLPAAPL